jgi:hypothetical protein
MAVFKSFSPKVEVNGETVLSIVAGMGSFKDQALKILEEKGIANPKPGQWYSQQSFLDAFQTISQKLGPATLFNIGKSIPENAQFPPGIDSIEKSLSSIDVAYHMNHRGGEIGSYKFESTGEKSGKMTCNTPYPAGFEKGIVEATAKKFKPAGTLVVVKENPASSADVCVFDITW